MRVKYVTTNNGKFKEAQHVLVDWELIHTPLDLPEIQGSAEEIVLNKAEQAKKEIDSAFIVEDVSMYLAALDGFPGPYIKPMLSILGPQGLYNLVHRYNNYRASVVCHVVYSDPSLTEFILCKGVVEGMIVSPREGTTEHGKINFNPIFVPFGYEKSFVEMPFSEIIHCSMRAKALNQLKLELELKTCKKRQSPICPHVN